MNEDMDKDMEMDMDAMMDYMRDVMRVWTGLEYRTLYGHEEHCSCKGGLAKHLT